MEERKVVIVDDHVLVLEGISSLIEQLGPYRIVGKAENGKQALEIIEMIQPDIVLMDVDMPVMNGLEATRKLKQLRSKLAIIILTMHGDPSLIKRMMEIGADGFLLKNADKSEFEEALNRVSAGKTYFSSDAAQAIISGKNVTPGNFTVGQDTVLLSTLSDRETEVLRHISQGMSNKEIGEILHISHRTVDTHRTNLMKKLNVHNTAALVRIAIKNGMLPE